jgi:hypothetical protein
VVVRNNKATAVIAPLSVMEQASQLDEREEDLRLAALALVRLSTTSGRMRPLEDVATDLGFDLDQLESQGTR